MLQSEWSLDNALPIPQLPRPWAKAVVASLALLCFGISYDGDFVFDDSEAIINNMDLRPETSLGNLWEHDFWGTNLISNTSHKSYRPLTVLTFRLNYLVAGGLHPIGFHVVNITLHSVISVMMLDVFSVLLGGLVHDERGKLLNKAPKASFLAALLFAVHPVHTESVAGIVGRADLLCALFFLLSFISYCKAFGKYHVAAEFSLCWIFASLLLCAVAMLCKEQGITVLGVNIVFDALVVCKVDILQLGVTLLGKDKTSERSLTWIRGFFTRVLLLSSGGAVLLYCRWRIMGTGPPAFTEVDNPASFADSALVRTFNYNYYYSLNAWLLVCPWWLCFDWSMGCLPLIKSFSEFRILALLALWFFLIGITWQSLFSKSPDERRILASGITLVIIPFLPASNIFFRVGFVIAERVIYLSSTGYCILLSYAMCVLSRKGRRIKNLLSAALLGLITLNVMQCIRRSNHWRSEEALFTSALSVCPFNAKVHYNVGKNLADRGKEESAILYYREAVRLHPTYVHAMNNLGNILKERKELHEAEKLLSSAVAIQPDFAAAWMNLGIVQNSLKKFEEAEKSYWTAIKYRKRYPDCYYNLGRLYADLHRNADALSAWQNATLLKPNHGLAWNNMIILLDNTGNLAKAEAVGKEALKLLPNDHTIMFSFANVLGKLKKYKESESLFLKALQRNPKIASYHGNLAVLYHRWGKLKLAKERYEIALKLDPASPGIVENYSLLKKKLEQLKQG
ncbi:protein O-mannosyl-transferase TMTC4 isoform X2 [Hypanus sabinus]|nr:protein O-mannosyl-transferase TMTC4 isoform X2 [Hypanus sabinus]XP_059826493.1 protein O-mannosyl-transferase TMTC4 isoform X2 [Hypanus sabinus]XP_059826494.1 protein O-mannosyl-transferase TMTC4 isoform X2 [Hypanus sabinus]XP_059826495.1 protein O-mannosyl-transferase TMTC4 isoform X2 [Hypanus sabinus]